MKSFTVLITAIFLFSCISSGSNINNVDEPIVIEENVEINGLKEDKKIKEVVFSGTIVAYGSEPNIVWMIKDLEGNLYYPKGDLQTVISKIPHDKYKWRGEIKSPISSLPGLIPEHIGHFTEISWEKELF